MALRSRRWLRERQLWLGQQRARVLQRRVRKHFTEWAGAVAHCGPDRRRRLELLLRSLPIYVGENHDAEQGVFRSRPGRSAHQAACGPGTLAGVLVARKIVSALARLW